MGCHALCKVIRAAGMRERQGHIIKTHSVPFFTTGCITRAHFFCGQTREGLKGRGSRSCPAAHSKIKRRYGLRSDLVGSTLRVICHELNKLWRGEAAGGGKRPSCLEYGESCHTVRVSFLCMISKWNKNNVLLARNRGPTRQQGLGSTSEVNHLADAALPVRLRADPLLGAARHGSRRQGRQLGAHAAPEANSLLLDSTCAASPDRRLLHGRCGPLGAPLGRALG